MTRHFIRVYLLVVLAIAGVSWSQERLWLAYSSQSAAPDSALTAALAVIERRLLPLSPTARAEAMREFANIEGLNVELMPLADIAGARTLQKLARGESTLMQAAPNETWLLKQLDAATAVALKRVEKPMQRGPLEWALSMLLYAAIALAVMIWLWPLTRDLRELETATESFGDGNWLFNATIGQRSQVYALSQAFKKMAARIDELIGSQRDLTNAISHEIKTPLARMQFEIEAAQRAADVDALRDHLNHIKGDIEDLNALLTATLDYAFLERADMSLNVGSHDFTQLIPAVAEYVRHSAPAAIEIRCATPTAATRVHCDARLMETALKNLLFNAIRHAQTRVEARFSIDDDGYRLAVDDDGPGIPEADRERVFGPFVQLTPHAGKKEGFGLGLAIVRRIAQWHQGGASVEQSPLGGASFVVHWPKAAD